MIATYVRSGIYKDDWFYDLDGDEQRVFMYLLVNEAVTLYGIYRLPYRTIASDLRLSLEKVAEIMARFRIENKIYYRDNWVVMRNWFKNQRLNKNHWSYVVKEFNKLPGWLCEALLTDTNEGMYMPFNTLSDGYVMVSEGHVLAYEYPSEMKQKVEANLTQNKDMPSTWPTNNKKKKYSKNTSYSSHSSKSEPDGLEARRSSPGEDREETPGEREMREAREQAYGRN